MGVDMQDVKWRERKGTRAEDEEWQQEEILE